MAFKVYPDPPTSPLDAFYGIESDLIPFAPASDLSLNQTFYILVAISDPTCSSSSLTVETVPTVWIKADSGDEYPLSLSSSTYIWNTPVEWPTDTRTIVDMSFDLENNLLLIEIHIQNSVIPVAWYIKFQNNDDSTDRIFTWVVADTEGEASQSWLDISSTTDLVPTDTGTAARELNFDDTTGKTTLCGQQRENTLQISNRGTGALTIDNADIVGSGDSTFVVNEDEDSGPTLPITIPPNSCGDLLIYFNAPTSPGEYTPTCDIDSSDTLANIDPENYHNKQVQLRASCGKLETVMVLDASGSMRYSPDGSVVPVSVDDSRWGKMTVAADQFLDLLGFFAGDLGKIGIVIFPEIRQPPETFPDPTANVIRSPIPLPSDLSDIKALLRTEDNTPDAGFGWTPIGMGIETAMGASADDFGLFESATPSKDHNLRWILLMSDGAHNQGPPNPPDFYTSFIDKNIKVAAAAYGDESAIHWPPDHTQMQDLAMYSLGEYLNAGEGDTGIDPEEGRDILKIFREALISQLALDPTTDPGGVLTESAPEIRRHIAVLPYDRKVAFIVNWASFDENRVRVQLKTPNCELITPQVAQSLPQVQYYNHPRYAIYAFDHDYLRNASEPTKPRYGNWTLIISGNDLNDDGEPYEYDVITQSRLNMRLEFDKDKYYAGESITLTAKLTLGGKPIPNATVTLKLSAPGQSAGNWLAAQRITSEEYDKAAESLKGADVTPLAIKAHAIKQKGLNFKTFIRPGTITMTDPENGGVYSTSYAHTPVPGIYNFHVTAIGQTEEGVIFRREKQLQKYLDVRPIPEFTRYHVSYRQISENNRRYLLSDIRVWPRDRFDNTVLIEPDFNPIIHLSSQAGEATGPLVGNLDGSYTRTFRSAIDAKMTFMLNVKGESVIESQRTLSVACLHYADQIHAFEPGVTDKDQSDQHRNPEEALGDITIKQEDQFVSLGIFGSLALGLKGQDILAGSGEDVVVFVKPDDELHPYQVEALPIHAKEQWVELGTSPGVTSAFSLRTVGLKYVKSIRINDRSSHSGSVSSIGSGVNILGVGFEKVGPGSGHADGCLWMPVTIIRRLLGSMIK